MNDFLRADIGIVASVDAGEGFTIDTKVMVHGSAQYKVHNSKGEIYYITVSSAYAKVK